MSWNHTSPHYAGKITAAGLGALALAGGFTFAAYQKELSAIRKKVAEGSTLAQTSVGPVEYGTAGKGAPVLVIHGAGGGYDQGLYIGEYLGPEYRVIAPSRFGYLRSPVLQDGSHRAQAAAHAALLDSLGIDGAVIVGVSAGAPSAIEFALRYPERVHALVLLVPRAYAPGEMPGVANSRSNRIVLTAIENGADFAYWAASRVWRSAVVRFLGVLPELDRLASAESRADLTRVMNSLQPLSARMAGLRNDSSNPAPRWPLELIHAPTLVVSLKDDLFNTLPAARFTAERIPNASLVVLETGGHLMVGRREEMTRIVADFLTGIAPPQEAKQLRALVR